MLSIQRLLYVTHVVKDRHAAEELYVRVFGAQVFHRGPLPATGVPATLLLVREMCLALVAASDWDGPPDPYIERYGGRHAALGIQVAGADAAQHHLERHGHVVERRSAQSLVADVRHDGGVRLELTSLGLPNDPRTKPDWSAAYWTTEHPLRLLDVWAVSALVQDVHRARAFWSNVMGARELGQRVKGEFSKMAFIFAAGDTRVSLMEPQERIAELARVVAAQGNGIHTVLFTCESLEAAAKHLRSHGFGLLGTTNNRYVNHPRSCFGARYLFMPRPAPDDPRFAWHTESGLFFKEGSAQMP
ncbi:MAG: hypothetical protein EXR49_05925 [Dehalococcoidia bacterium]|nr:hypothetical protein [Dehalococcoidia bacterium]